MRSQLITFPSSSTCRAMCASACLSYVFSVFSVPYKYERPGTIDDAMVEIWAQLVKKACYKNAKK
jgi:hypothetical protein